jgi:mutator protein MutT
MKQLTLLFLVKNDEVLLAMKKRGFGQGRWNGVGGKAESNESIEEAMIRECQEEIEVTPVIYEKAAEITFNEYHNEVKKQLYVHVFLCQDWQGEPVETEEMAPRWFKISDLPLAQMWPDDEYWLPLVLEGKKLKAEFSLDENDDITDHSIAVVEKF